MERFQKIKKEIILDTDGKVTYYPNWLPWSYSRELLDKLVSTLPLKPEKVLMFGNMIEQPRLISWHGDKNKSYSYSGLDLNPSDWTKDLLEVRDLLQSFLGYNFNSVLANYYEDGSKYVGWHADDETGLGPTPANVVIAAVSFGGPRAFGLKHRTKGIAHLVEPQCGSLLVMEGSTQRHWVHRIAKTAKKVNARLSLTFRVVVD